MRGLRASVVRRPRYRSSGASRARRWRGERGAYAVLFAILTTLLMGMAAIGVDIGNALARKSDVQGQADFAALAAAKVLSTHYTESIKTQATELVARSLNQNQPLNGTCENCVTKEELRDGALDNGEVKFTSQGVRVYAPEDRVHFGFANLLGYSHADVQATAMVQVFSPGRALPFYVSEACSYMQQTISDPAAGRDDTVLAPLVPTSGTENTALRSIAPNSTPLGVDPGEMVLVTQTNNGANGVTSVALTTRADGFSTPRHEEVILPAPASGDTIRFTIPAAVYDHEALWYVRINKAPVATPNWSQESLAFSVGSPTLYCEGMQSGNFGALRLSRSDSDHSWWAAINTSRGIQHNLGIMDSPVEPCQGYGGVVPPETPNTELMGVNCMSTEPGFTQQATQGFITGGHTRQGLQFDGLLEVPTTEGCNSGLERLVTIQRDQYTINDDHLTCFFTDPTVSVGQVSQRGTAAPEKVISLDIFASPRFFWLPVLSNDPTSARGGTWPIVDFRPAFLTGQPNSATITDPQLAATEAAGNGITTDVNGVEKVRVVLINDLSMPEQADGRVILSPYRGSGTKVIRLVD